MCTLLPHLITPLPGPSGGWCRRIQRPRTCGLGLHFLCSVEIVVVTVKVFEAGTLLGPDALLPTLVPGSPRQVGPCVQHLPASSCFCFSQALPRRTTAPITHNSAGSSPPLFSLSAHLEHPSWGWKYLCSCSSFKVQPRALDMWHFPCSA